MDVEFVLPTKEEELCAISSTQYVVSEVSSVREVNIYVGSFAQSLCDDGVEFIYKNFDVYYSIIRHFKELGEDLKFDAYEVLLKAAEQLRNELSFFLNDGDDDGPSGLKFKYRNLLKMAAYMMCQLADLHESQLTKPSTVITDAKKNRKKKKAMNEDNWSDLRRLFVKCIGEIYRLPISKLWEPPVVEEEFVNMVTLSFFKILENPNVDQKFLDDEIIDFLGYSLKTYKSNSGYSIKIVQLVQDFSHLGPILTNAVHAFITKYGAKSLMSELFKEVCCLEFQEMVHETARLHCLSEFLIELSERCFDETLASVTHFLPCLEEEPHVIRNCVLTVIGDLVVKISKLKDISREAASLRDRLLYILLGHMVDISAFVRSKCLQVVSQMFEQEAVPLHHQHRFLHTAVECLEDKASLVRKNAIHFLKLFIIANPYAAQLPVDELKKSYEKEEAVLKGMLPEYFVQSRNVSAILDSDDDDESEDGGSKTCDKEKDSEGKDASNNSAVGNEKGDCPEAAESSDEEMPKEPSQLEALNTRITEQQVLVEYLKQTANHAESIAKALPLLCQLLSSTTNTDVLEAIDFFTTAFQLNLRDSVLGIKAMMYLVFSKEPAIKSAVVSSYKKLYLTVTDEKSKSITASMIAQNLVLFLHGATDSEIIAIEEFIKEFIRSEDITEDVLDVLWDTFTIKSSATTDEQSLSSLVLLSMAASVKPDIVVKNLDLLLAEGLGPRAENSYLLAKEVCCALLKINSSSKVSVECTVPQFRLPETHPIFVRITHLLTDGITNMNDNDWISMADKAVGVIFQLANHPENIAATIIKKITKTFMSHYEADADGAVMIFCRMLFTAGQIVYCCVKYLEYDVLNELKRRAYQQDKKNKKKLPPRVQLLANENKNDSTINGEDTTESEDFISEYVFKLCEEILSEEYVFGKLYPLVLDACEFSLENFNHHVCSAASLSLAKFMAASPRICEENLQLLVTLMENCPEPEIRSTSLIAMADLVLRFPSEVTPWSSSLYDRLKDQSSLVRLNAAIVITHLILHDMIKVKGKISEIALCLIDEEEVSNVAKFLFSELSQKQNALYNILPDIISSLSDTSTQLNESDYQIIVRYIFQFIDKDKQIEALVEKLLHRLRDSSAPEQLRKIAFSLSLFPYNEKCFQKLVENKVCFKNKLEDEVVVRFLKDITSDIKKNKPNLEQEVDAFLTALDI